MKSLISFLLRAFSSLPSALCPAPCALSLLPAVSRLPFAVCLLLALCPLPPALCQIPQGFNYQAIAKDGSGNPIAGQILPVRISIQSDSLGGTIFWVELHSSVTTNSSGLFTLVVGKGAKQSGTAATFSAIDWSVWPKYIQTEIDYGGWKTLGSSKMWSVPYAMVSSTSDTWTTSGSDIYRTTGNVGIGVSNPIFKLQVQGGESLFGYNSGNGALRFITGFGNSFMFKPLDHALQIQTDHTGFPTILYLHKSGPIGVGNTDPAYILDVSGRIRLRTGGGSAGLWLNDAANTSVRSFIGMYDDNRVGLYGVGSNWGLVMDVNNGNVGIGTAIPGSNKLAVVGNVLIDGNILSGNLTSYGSIQGQAASGSGDVLFIGNDSKISDINLANTLGISGLQDANQGHIKLGANGPLISGFNGNVGIGNTTPASKLSVQVPYDAWADDVPLFEVKNEKGVPVFAVYNYGVRVLVDHNTAVKAPKGGFQVSSYNYSKVGETTPLMIINPDSIRFNIDNPSSKGVKGGFSVGSFADAKGISDGFLNISVNNESIGKYNVVMGYQAGVNSAGAHNTYIGKEAGYGLAGNNSGGNIFLGEGAGKNNYGGYRTDVFHQIPPLPDLVIVTSWGGENVAIGNYSGMNLTGTDPGIGNPPQYGSYNVLLGNNSGRNITTGAKNVLIGNNAGNNLVSGSSNVFIGYMAGAQETGSKKLYIANTNTTNPLIYGDFDFNYLKINGWMGIDVVPGTPFAIAGLTGTTSGSSLRILDNNIYYYSSSRKTKSDIQPFVDNFYKILKTNPVSFRDNVSGERNIGFIAEDFDAIGLNELVVYKNGEPISLNYELISIYNLEIIKDQQKRIESQEDKINRLEKLIMELEKKIASSR